MDTKIFLLAGVFLPLFPFSIIFNALFERLSHPILRGVMLLFWPLIGIYLLQMAQRPPPDWIIAWASATAILYGFRLISMRDVGLWIGFLATSAWALLWMGFNTNIDHNRLYLSALGFSTPLIMLLILATHIKVRFGAAYTYLYGGLAITTPRLSGVLVFTVLAATAAPIFPAFFIMLYNITLSAPTVIIAMLTGWLLWAWAGARLLQGLIVGPQAGRQIKDISRKLAWLYVLLLSAMVLSGFYLPGKWL